MWLQERLKTIDKSVADFAKELDINENTIRGWILRETIPFKIIETIEVKRLLTALQMEWIDLGRIYGYEVIASLDDIPAEDKTRLLALYQLPEWKQNLYRELADAAIKTVQSMDDDPLKAIQDLSS